MAPHRTGMPLRTVLARSVGAVMATFGVLTGCATKAVAPAASPLAGAGGSATVSTTGHLSPSSASGTAGSTAVTSTVASTSSAPLPAAAAGGGKAPTTVQYFTSLNPRQRTLYPQLVVTPFEQQNPTIKIDTIANTAVADYTKLGTMVAGGTPPDVVWEAYPQPYLAGLTTDVTSYVKRDKIDISIYPKYAFFYDGLWKDKVLGLPNQTGGSWPVLPYNHDLFAQAGLPDPSSTWGDPAWSYDALVQAGRQLTTSKPDGTPRTYALGGAFGSDVTVLYWGLRYGGQWLSDDYTTITCDSEEMITGMQQFFDLGLKHKIMPLPGRLQKAFGSTDPMALMKTGNLAMAQISGGSTFTVAEDDQQGANLAFAALPSFPQSSGAAQDTDPNGFAKGSKHLDAGWTLIRFLADTPGWAISRGNLPARIDHIAPWTQAVYGNLAAKTQVAVYAGSLQHSAKRDPIRDLPTWSNSYSKIIAPVFDKIWAGQTTVSDAPHSLKPLLQAQVPKQWPD
jgi:ABC-type glycerol-3-phosphate transport system substrate-binding protein